MNVIINLTSMDQKDLPEDVIYLHFPPSPFQLLSYTRGLELANEICQKLSQISVVTRITIFTNANPVHMGIVLFIGHATGVDPRLVIDEKGELWDMIDFVDGGKEAFHKKEHVEKKCHIDELSHGRML